MMPLPPTFTLFPYTTLFRSWFPVLDATVENGCLCVVPESHKRGLLLHCPSQPGQAFDLRIPEEVRGAGGFPVPMKRGSADRKSTRLNSSHLVISYAVFCLKK